MISTRLFLLALGLAAPASAQYPPGTQWRTIRTAHFDVVFPSEVEPDTQRLANALETMYQPLSQSLGATLPRHNTFLLANQGVTRNSAGYVSLMPRMATMLAMARRAWF
jgi:hypothetical protein